MLEVYFNIIEWGPNVYGAQEASQFYFNKPASDININEAIYMAMIVPRPKGFMYNFEKDGKLKAYTNEYFQLMKRHMLRKSLVAESDSISSTLVNITGPALKYVLKVDSLPVDTIEQPEIFLPEE
jgi:membrane carboxypeptidase/penicillin-binding protein PbpC